MMKSAKTKIFILCQTAVYAAFMFMDVLGVGSSAPVKFAGMVLCCVFSAIFSADGGELTVTAAVLLAAAADVFLLLLDAEYAVGVLLFCAVQLLYFVRIFRANGRKAAPAARILLFAAAAVLLWTLGIATAVNVLVCAYFTFFLCNTVQSFKIKNRLFSVGLCLFFVLRYLRRNSQSAVCRSAGARESGGAWNVGILSAVAGAYSNFGEA